ncbi:MAG: Glu-tRNA(Gln) amidotransferase subunit GatE [Promethearchaeota archaeon]
MASKKNDVGLMVGLEIHQQLDTREKLFCRCPTQLQGTREPDFRVMRTFRPVLGEMGEFDEAMLLEFKKGMTVHYEGYHDVVCTYELDETPPFKCNEEALDVALEIACLLNMNIFNELHVCRKNYLDGSVPCGFQRTMIVAQDGWYPLESGKRIGIDIICLEEDACRKISIEGRDIFFRLDRLGIPLVEVTTKPDIDDPLEAREAAYRLGLLLRGTGKVKKIIGSTRQDINVSIKGGERIEIKGVQKLDWIPPLIEREISRQQGLIAIRDLLHEKGATPSSIGGKTIDLTGIFRKTKCKFFQSGIKRKHKVLGLNVPGFAGIFGRELQPDYRFGTEVSDRVKIITGLSGIIHSDEDLKKYNFSDEEIAKVRQKLGTGEGDAFVLILGPPEKVKAAFVQVTGRLQEAFEGVPPETRRAKDDMNTEFLRKLHGGARLYPDTDSQEIEIAPSRIDEVRGHLGKYPWELKEELSEKFKISEDQVERLILNGFLKLFLELVGKSPELVKLVTTTLLETTTAVRREGKEVGNIQDESYVALFDLIRKGKLGKEAIEPILMHLSDFPNKSLDAVIESEGLAGISEDVLDEIIAKVLEKDASLVKERGMRAMGPVMGDVMKEVRGKIDGKIVSARLKSAMQEYLKKIGGK